MYTTVFLCHSALTAKKLLSALSLSLFFPDPSLVVFACMYECVESEEVGGQTNAFQSVAGFSFPPAVDEDGGRGREKGRGGN